MSGCAHMNPLEVCASCAPKMQPCGDCGHALSIHDTGWDAAGCMVGDCSCRTYCEPKHAKHPTGDYCVYCRAQWPCEESLERLSLMLTVAEKREARLRDDFDRALKHDRERDAELERERQLRKAEEGRADQFMAELERWRSIPAAMREHGFPEIGDTPIAVTASIALLQEKLAEAQADLIEEVADNVSLREKHVTQGTADHVAALEAKLADAEGSLVTESAERIRCRDGWAGSEAKLAEAQNLLDSLKTEAGKAAFALANGWPLPEEVAALAEVERLHSERIEHLGKIVSLQAEVERLREALGRVLTEAGLQAHKHGCANKIARPAQWDARLPCAGCQAESALQGR